jgi:HAMP domain-containing protein
MTATANHLVPQRGKLGRALAAVFAWIEAMDYTSFDYTLDRIERLEREVGELKEELRQSRDTAPPFSQRSRRWTRTSTAPRAFRLVHRHW